MYIGPHVKNLLFMSHFSEIFSFSTDFEKESIPNFMKIRPVEPSCSMGEDRQTQMTKILVAFRNFCEGA